MTTDGFEYKKKKNEIPFETFLRYTDEKERSAVKLAAILKGVLQDDSRVLDIGTGNGEYLDLALSKVSIPGGMKLTLVEPSGDLLAQLGGRFEKWLPATSIKVVNSSLQDLGSDESFDVILMSHLFYHVPRATWTEQLEKVLDMLKPNGVLIVVLREKDDVYDFKMTFKPLLFDESFQALTISDVLSSLPKAMKLRVVKYKADSKLNIPFENNREDTISIVEFFLNKQWEEMPESVRRGAIEFIKAKRGVFRQLDCIAVIKKL